MTEPIVLYGCAPEPLIHYLKALGVLRLVAEQLDPQARGAWLGDAFALETSRTKNELVNFFFAHYRPTPLGSPWNGGSGFYDGDDITGREAIRTSTTERFEVYRDAIIETLGLPELPSVGHLTVKDLLDQVEQAITLSKNQEGKDVVDWKNTVASAKGELGKLSEVQNLEGKTIEQLEEIKESISDKTEKKKYSELLQPVKKLRTIVKKFKRASGKDEIIRACRNRLNDQAVEWIDAAVVLFENESGEAPLLGVGGIDGKLEFAKNFMARLGSVMPEIIEDGVRSRRQKDLNKNAQTPAKLAKVNQQIVQQTTEISDGSKQNLRASLFAECSPYLENAAVGQLQPSGAGGAPNASNSPKIDSGEGMVNPWDFILALEGSLVLASATVRQLAAGARTRASFPFTTEASTIGYGTAVSKEKVRAEIWLPLWSRLSSYAEVAHIFREGRVQFSRRRKVVRTGFDFARAISELGADRGIESFQRYAFIERNGQANLATPLGKFEVRERPRARLIHHIDQWLDSFSRAASGDKVQPRFVRTQQRIEDAIFRLCESGSADHLREVLISLGAAEAELADGEKFRSEKNLRPLTGLRLSWVNECSDGSEEFKLAAALASICGASGGAIRENIEPVSVIEKRIEWKNKSVHAVWGNGSLEDNLAAVLHRRSIEARAQSLPHPILTSSRFVSLKTVNAFLYGETDDARVEELLRGLVLLDWRKAEQDFKPQTRAREVPPSLPRAYALLKLLFLPDGKFQRNEGGETIIIKHEPSIVPLLKAGRVRDALQIAYQRLQASGLAPATKEFHYDDSEGTRLAAALLIPIDEPSIRALAKLVLRDKTEDQ